jgi:hypothetical protein
VHHGTSNFGDGGRVTNAVTLSGQTTDSYSQGTTLTDATVQTVVANANELEETDPDPDLNAWFDTQGYENADKCAWNFGTTSSAANGAKHNLTLGGKQYLVQQNWIATAGPCALSYTTPMACTPGKSTTCCAFAQGCGCVGDKTCNASGQWGSCIGSTPKGTQCP